VVDYDRLGAPKAQNEALKAHTEATQALLVGWISFGAIETRSGVVFYSHGACLALTKALKASL
jgi:hypothetical protein